MRFNGLGVLRLSLESTLRDHLTHLDLFGLALNRESSNSVDFEMKGHGGCNSLTGKNQDLFLRCDLLIQGYCAMGRVHSFADHSIIHPLRDT